MNEIKVYPDCVARRQTPEYKAYHKAYWANEVASFEFFNALEIVFSVKK